MPLGRKRPSRVPPGETETWMSCASAAAAKGATAGHPRRRQDLVAAGQAPIESQALPQPAPQPEPGPAGEGAVQRREGDAGEPAGDAPLQAAEAQGPDQPDQAPPQGEVRLA